MQEVEALLPFVGLTAIILPTDHLRARAEVLLRFVEVPVLATARPEAVLRLHPAGVVLAEAHRIAVELPREVVAVDADRVLHLIE